MFIKSGKLESVSRASLVDQASSASYTVTTSSADLTVVALVAVITMAACSVIIFTTCSSSLSSFTITHTIILGNADDEDGGILLGSSDGDCGILLSSGDDDGALGTEGSFTAAGEEEQLDSSSREGAASQRLGWGREEQLHSSSGAASRQFGREGAASQRQPRELHPNDNLLKVILNQFQAK